MEVTVYRLIFSCFVGVLARRGYDVPYPLQTFPSLWMLHLDCISVFFANIIWISHLQGLLMVKCRIQCKQTVKTLKLFIGFYH